MSKKATKAQRRFIARNYRRMNEAELAGTEVLTKRFNVTGGPVFDVEYTPGS